MTARVKYTVVTILFLCIAACTPLVQQHNPTRQTPQLQRDVFVTSDGTKLPLRTWKSSGQPSAIVVALHGYNDYSNGFALPGPYLAANGILVFAYDQRGFGASPQRGIWPGPNLLVRDVRDMVILVKKRYPGIPVYLLGASMGAAVAMNAEISGNQGVDGLILAAPAVWGGDGFNFFYRSVLWVGAHTVPWLHVSGRGIDITLSDDKEVVHAMQADPLVLPASRIDAVYGIEQLMDSTHAVAAEIKAPVLFLYGLKDEVIPLESVCQVLSEFQAPYQAIFYPEGYHLILRDKQRERVWLDIIHWINHSRSHSTTDRPAECRNL